MKYIRTKDGRILEESKCEEFSVDDYSAYMLGKLKEADTIEELFDWLVFKRDGKIMVLYETWDLAAQGEGQGVLRFDEVYGAIETDKGLIYVAKLNKGEFELL